MGIPIADNFSYKGKKPLDERTTFATVAAMKAVNEATLYNGITAYVAETDKEYKFLSTNEVDETTGKWREKVGGVSEYSELSGLPTMNDVEIDGDLTSSDLGLQDEMQFTTMPAASEDYLGKIVQFKGATGTYTHGFFYECVSDGESTPTYSWVPTSVQSGSSGGGSITNAITAAVDVGGISTGKTYAAGTDIETIIADMLEPTLFPTFTAPSASLAYSASQYYAVGATVSAATATVSLNRGAITPAYGTSGYRSGAANGFSIATSGADTEYSNTSDSSGSFNVPALTRATKGNIVITGTASYDAGEQPKDSKGGDYSSPLAAGTVSATKTLTFIQPYYYGAVNSASISDFTGLTENVTAKGQKTFNYTTNNQYMVFAYDSSYGNLKTILDGNGFDVTGGWTKSTKTVDGFTYNVYISNSPTTDTNAPFTFKY